MPFSSNDSCLSNKQNVWQKITGNTETQDSQETQESLCPAVDRFRQFVKMMA